MNLEALKRDLIRDEEERLKPYRCTSGKLTIGVGRNLEALGISRDESAYMLANDIARVVGELDRNLPWWADLPEPARRGLANMAFNLGWPRLSTFRKMLAALEAGQWDRAAFEALDSEWAGQVGDRAPRIADLFRSCGS